MKGDKGVSAGSLRDEGPQEIAWLQLISNLSSSGCSERWWE